MHRHKPAPPRMTFAPPPPHGCRRVDPDRHRANPDRRPHTDLVGHPRMTSKPPPLHDHWRRRRPVAPARPPPPHEWAPSIRVVVFRRPRTTASEDTKTETSTTSPARVRPSMVGPALPEYVVGLDSASPCRRGTRERTTGGCAMGMR
jgi:hypothetical protein